MRRVIFVLSLVAVLGLLTRTRALAQSNEQESAPLGDVARALRSQKRPELPVITNDNFSRLPQLIKESEQQALAAGLIAPPQQTLTKHAEPEITCSFAFSAKAQSAPDASSAIKQDLPASALAKLDGPAVIAGDTLQVSIYNGSNWDVQEITVGLTIVKHERAVAGMGSPRFLPAAASAGPVPMLKKPDETVLYHLKGSAPPMATTAFQQALGFNLNPSDEWHWAILQARGIPPAPPAATGQ